MVDLHYSDPDLADRYDDFCPWDERGDFGFYFPLVMAAESVLDVGCGTGALLRAARAAGHPGRLCGVDPAPAMLRVARACRDVEWVEGDASSVRAGAGFALAVMTGHAFQVLLADDEIGAALDAIARALAPGGCFAFETRNPKAREWEEWTPDRAEEVIGDDGVRVRMAHQVVAVTGDRVTFTSTYSSPAWSAPRVSHSTLRFLDVPALGSFLTEAGLDVDEQFGDWDRQPVAVTSPEIITLARRA